MTSVYSAAGGKGDYPITGEVLFGVSYKKGQLLIHVDRARDLAAADSNGYSDPYVKTYLLPDKSKDTKKKTEIRKKTFNPVYDHIIKVSMSILYCVFTTPCVYSIGWCLVMRTVVLCG